MSKLRGLVTQPGKVQGHGRESLFRVRGKKEKEPRTLYCILYPIQWGLDLENQACMLLPLCELPDTAVFLFRKSMCASPPEAVERAFERLKDAGEPPRPHRPSLDPLQYPLHRRGRLA